MKSVLNSNIVNNNISNNTNTNISRRTKRTKANSVATTSSDLSPNDIVTKAIIPV